MKIWKSFGSEHSMNLVLIGTFKDEEDAEEALSLVKNITAHVEKEPELSPFDRDPHSLRYSKEMLDFFAKNNINTIGPDELFQFIQDIHIERTDGQIIISTEEADVSAFLKLFIQKGARVEVYSAHDYPDTEYGR